MPEIDLNLITIAFTLVGVVIQIAGCTYQHLTLRKMKKLRQEIELLSMMATPVTGGTNGKVLEMTRETPP